MLHSLAMEHYELVLLVPAHGDKEVTSQLVHKIKEILSEVEAKLVKETDWGVKRMAYAINKQMNAQYLLWEVAIKKGSIREMHRLLNFETQLLRYVLLKVSDTPKSSAATASVTEETE